MMNPIFLISTGRTGTKYLSKFFSSYGVNIISCHTSGFSRLINILGNMYYYKLIQRDLMEVIWKKLKFKEIQSKNSRYIECNPYYYNLIDIIKNLFPEAKFIFVIRSPRSFIISHINWERQRWKSMIANRIIPFWQPTSYIDQIMGLKNNYHQRVEFYSKIWVRKNLRIMKGIKGNDNVITLKFEEIFDPVIGVRTLRRLIKWLNISLLKPIKTELLTAKMNKSNNDKNDFWDKHCTRIMNKYCSPLISTFRYE